MHNDIFKILVTEEQIDEATTRIANEIDRDYGGKSEHLVLLGILKGSIPFLADLMKKVKSNLKLSSMVKIIKNKKYTTNKKLMKF